MEAKNVKLHPFWRQCMTDCYVSRFHIVCPNRGTYLWVTHEYLHYILCNDFRPHNLSDGRLEGVAESHIVLQDRHEKISLCAPDCSANEHLALVRVAILRYIDSCLLDSVILTLVQLFKSDMDSVAGYLQHLIYCAERGHTIFYLELALRMHLHSFHLLQPLQLSEPGPCS